MGFELIPHLVSNSIFSWKCQSEFSTKDRLSSPPIGWFKCNTDEAFKGNRGPSGDAFWIRDYNGDLLRAKGMKIPDSTNLVAGAIAIREGVKYILENQFSHTIIEFDSLAMVNMI